MQGFCAILLNPIRSQTVLDRIFYSKLRLIGNHFDLSKVLNKIAENNLVSEILISDRCITIANKVPSTGIVGVVLFAMAFTANINKNNKID